MDEDKQQSPQPRSPSSSVDGFLPPRPPAPTRHAIPVTGPPPTQPSLSPRRPAFTPPSAAKRPFQPAEFFTPPPIPKLPEIKAEPLPEVKEPPKRPQGLRDVLSVMGVLASALLLAFCLINFVFQSYQVEGPSMRATLENSDHLIVWKVDRTIANVTGRPYIPHRGDVVIFNEPSSAEAGGRVGKQLIKRVIGLPGDRVVLRDTEVMIYNKENPDGFNPDKTMPYGKLVINEKPSNGDWTLEPGEIFVVGDNRDNSLDSRVFGPLNADNIVGKLVVRILPLNTFKLF